MFSELSSAIMEMHKERVPPILVLFTKSDLIEQEAGNFDRHVKRYLQLTTHQLRMSDINHAVMRCSCKVPRGDTLPKCDGIVESFEWLSGKILEAV
ncbi:MAG: hypothetical protein JW779_14475 [Candidatus Thorarchaeota archaeon]|nr:hypothetical protein [Candidatus Thorarchaeota archaeon]